MYLLQNVVPVMILGAVSAGLPALEDVPNWSDASAVIQEALQASLSGQMPPDEAMQQAAAQMKTVLGK